MKTCLVVDDSKVIRKVARLMLEALDFTVEEAGDGREALDRCHVQAPDVVLLDAIGELVELDGPVEPLVAPQPPGWARVATGLARIGASPALVISPAAVVTGPLPAAAA